VDKDSRLSGLDVEVVITWDGEVPHPAGAGVGVVAAQEGGGGAGGGGQVGAVFEGCGFGPAVGCGCVD